MLVHARMKVVALAVAMVAASSEIASAGGYVGLGIGTAPAVNAANFDTHNATAHEDGRSVRLLGGFRLGRIGVEAALNRFSFVYDNGNRFDATADQLQIAGRYTL